MSGTTKTRLRAVAARLARGLLRASTHWAGA
jgi:hypothetical protein